MNALIRGRDMFSAPTGGESRAYETSSPHPCRSDRQPVPVNCPARRERGTGIARNLAEIHDEAATSRSACPRARPRQDPTSTDPRGLAQPVRVGGLKPLISSLGRVLEPAGFRGATVTIRLEAAQGPNTTPATAAPNALEII